MKKVCVFTSTRADYGLLYWLMKAIEASQQLTLQILVSGTHLSTKHGNTQQQIEEDGFFIDEKVNIYQDSNNNDLANSTILDMQPYGKALQRLNPEVLVLLGDRYETLAIAMVALQVNIPILHIHGGEITEGANDDAMRHAITKLSQFHCTATEEYRKRVIQLGEQPNSVANVGALGLEFAAKCPLLSLDQFKAETGIFLDKPFFLVTYHPETLSNSSQQENLKELFWALDEFSSYQIIITFPNADVGADKLVELIKSYAEESPDRVFAVPSLGSKNYLSAMSLATLVIGNSSSGIIEAPFFQVPTINIGDRQKGRLAAKSVHHCEPKQREIVDTIKHAISSNSLGDLATFDNPYGNGNTSHKIVKILETRSFTCSKSFYDIANTVPFGESHE